MVDLEPELFLLFLCSYTVFIVLYLYFEFKHFIIVYSWFRKRGVRTVTFIPIYDYLVSVITGAQRFVSIEQKLRHKYPKDRFTGRYLYKTPIVVLQDLDLIKSVTTRNFESFLDRIGHIDMEPFTSRNLYNLRGQDWKNMRSAISPAFSTPKVQNMIPLMKGVADFIVEDLVSVINNTEEGYIQMDITKLTQKAVIGMIGVCVFGLDVSSITKPDSEFIRMGMDFSQSKYCQLLSEFGECKRSCLSTEWFKADHVQYYFNLVKDLINQRELPRVHMPYLVNYFLLARKGLLRHSEMYHAEKKQFGFASVSESKYGKQGVKEKPTDIDLASQAAAFFTNGYDTVAIALTYALHELSLKPEIQSRLLKEIILQDVITDGTLTFECIQNMKYMDRVVSETLRLWPPQTNLQRLCTKDINIGKPNFKASEDYIVRAGETVTIPVWAIHRDPKLFPNPETFDPDRFSDTNKHKIKPMSYMPFGIGPRNCIGSNFALCELKVLLYYILLRIEVLPSEQACIPSKLQRDCSELHLEGGYRLKFKFRTSE